jgi:hypothetical protein
MAAPNLVSVTAVYGKSICAALVTGGVEILANAAASGKVLKVGTLLIANIDGAASADVTLSFVDASPAVTTKFANTVPVPADSTLVAIGRDTPIYLEEGDSITGVASADGDLIAIVSYEELA